VADLPVHSRHDTRDGAEQARLRQPPCDPPAILWRVRFAPDSRHPAFPWALIAFPWWQRLEADMVDPDGQVTASDGLWHCSCGATWERGLLCPNCMQVQAA
jgi:hypothetical protein